jgi:hypothetical protein
MLKWEPSERPTAQQSLRYQFLASEMDIGEEADTTSVFEVAPPNENDGQSNQKPRRKIKESAPKTKPVKGSCTQRTSNFQAVVATPVKVSSTQPAGDIQDMVATPLDGSCTQPANDILDVLVTPPKRQ